MKKWEGLLLSIMLLGNSQSVQAKEKVTHHKAKVICIDAGHQERANVSLEPNGPGSKVKKMKVTDGAGCYYTHKREAIINLEVALKLQRILKKKGYRVVMVRKSQKVNIANSERAKIANRAHADVMIRLHCNGTQNTSDHGYFILTPSKHNPFLSKHVIKDSLSLTKCLLSTIEKKTHARNRGISYRDDLTGTNFAKMPTALIEMGEMHNKKEELLLASDSYQEKMAQGIAMGIMNFLK